MNLGGSIGARGGGLNHQVPDKLSTGGPRAQSPRSHEFREGTSDK